MGPLQPPTVNINGRWDGSYTRDGASGQMYFYFFDQAGQNSVTGQFWLIEGPDERPGAITGTLSGNTLTFAFGFGMNCVRTLTGSGTFVAGAFHNNTLTGTFSGESSCGDKYTNGHITLPIQRPTPGPLIGSSWKEQETRFFGASAPWTWQITTLTVIRDGFTVTGSVTVGSGETTGSLSGTLLYVGFPDTNGGGSGTPSHRWRLQDLTISLSGRCPSTLTGRSSDSQSYFGAQAPQIRVVLSGNTCSQQVNNLEAQLARQ
jgi:hypothetical protein